MNYSKKNRRDKCAALICESCTIVISFIITKSILWNKNHRKFYDIKKGKNQMRKIIHLSKKHVFEMCQKKG